MRFSGSSLIATLVFLVCSAGLAQPRPSKSFETAKLGEGIYAFLSEESLTEVVSGNSVAIIGDDGVLVVDTGDFPSLAREMIRQIREKTQKPVRFVIHTHWHPDHLMGDGEFRRAFPGVVVVSTEFTRKEIIEQAPKYVRVEKGPEYIQTLQQQLAAGRTQDGATLNEAEKKFLSKRISDVQFAFSEFQKAELVIPDLTFDRNLSIHLGKREIQVSFLGRGNTGGDAVIFVPDSKVVMTGDLIVYPTPYSYGSYPGEWVEVLKTLMQFDATTIVPGHGPVFHDWGYAKTLVALIESVRTQVQAAVKEGLDLDATRKRVNLADFRKRLAGDDPDRGRAFDVGFAQPAVDRAYQEVRGSFEEE
jgi:cyclase